MLFGFSPKKLWRRRVRKPTASSAREEELRRVVRQIRDNISMYSRYKLSTLVEEETKSLKYYERLLAAEVQEG